MKRAHAVALAALGTLVSVAVGTRQWVSGTTDDAVLGQTTVTLTGSQVAPGAVALTLVVAAAVIASVLAGPRLRRVVLAIGAAAALGHVLLIAWVLARPEATLGPAAATAAGRSGSLPVQAVVSGAAWVGLAAALVLLAAASGALVSVGRWQSSDARYASTPAAGDDPPAASAGARGERAHEEWDALSAGHDPTDVPPERPT